MTVTSGLIYTHRQKEERNRKEKRRQHPVRAQTNTQNQKMVPRPGAAPPHLVNLAESEGAAPPTT